MSRGAPALIDVTFGAHSRLSRVTPIDQNSQIDRLIESILQQWLRDTPVRHERALVSCFEIKGVTMNRSNGTEVHIELEQRLNLKGGGGPETDFLDHARSVDGFPNPQPAQRQEPDLVCFSHLRGTLYIKGHNTY
jgi:hypothetical protein